MGAYFFFKNSHGAAICRVHGRLLTVASRVCDNMGSLRFFLFGPYFINLRVWLNEGFKKKLYRTLNKWYITHYGAVNTQDRR